MKLLRFLVVLAVVFVFSVGFALAEPSGATVTPGTSSSAGADAAGTDTNALAGNVTLLTISGNSNTQSWQGYFGNVTGAIRLADSSDNVMYNWSLASPSGEVYASNASSITWSSIDCVVAAGLSFSSIESDWNIGSTDADGVDETFNLNNHPEFYTGSVQHTAGECNNTKVYNSSGVGAFDEVILSDGTSVVFAALLQDNANGFDGDTYDFEMLVLEDGHNGDTATDTYYFWVELE